MSGSRPGNLRVREGHDHETEDPFRLRPRHGYFRLGLLRNSVLDGTATRRKRSRRRSDIRKIHGGGCQSTLGVAIGPGDDHASGRQRTTRGLVVLLWNRPHGRWGQRKKPCQPATTVSLRLFRRRTLRRLHVVLKFDRLGRPKAKVTFFNARTKGQGTHLENSRSVHFIPFEPMFTPDSKVDHCFNRQSIDSFLKQPLLK